MASSSPQELSQESDELKGSYFTHHLVTALRGAGDADGDGRVSLDEAYRYAYRRTLASTARTQVGEQHVTLETDLAGQGDVPVTYPGRGAARSSSCPRRSTRACWCSTGRAARSWPRCRRRPGPPSASRSSPARTTRRRAEERHRAVPLRPRRRPRDAARHARAARPWSPTARRPRATSPSGTARREIDRWAIEGSARRHDARRPTPSPTAWSDVRLPAEVVAAARRAVLAGRVARARAAHRRASSRSSTLSSDTYQRSIGGEHRHDHLRRLRRRRCTCAPSPTSRASGSASTGRRAGACRSGRLTATDAADGRAAVDDQHVRQLPAERRDRRDGEPRARVPLTLFVQGGYDYAPAIHDLIGDTHDSGGFSVVLGLRLRLGDGP